MHTNNFELCACSGDKWTSFALSEIVSQAILIPMKTNGANTEPIGTGPALIQVCHVNRAVDHPFNQLKALKANAA